MRPTNDNKPMIDGKMSEYVKKKHSRTLRRLLGYFKFFPFITIAALMLALLSNITATLKPYILEQVIDKNLTVGVNDFDSLVTWAMVYLGIVIAGVVTSYAQSLVLSSLGQRVLHKIRTTLFEKVQNMSMTFFDRNASGSILTRFSSDVESLSELFSDVLINFVRDFLMIANVVVMMLILDPGLTLFSMSIIPVILGIAILYRWLARRIFIKIKAQMSKMNGFLAENIIGMKIVQIFGKQAVKNAEYEKLTGDYYKLTMTDMVLRSLSNPLLGLVGNIAVGVLVIRYAGDVLSGVLLVGVLHAFTTYIKQFIQPVARIAEQFTNIQSALISAERIFDILDNTEDAEDMTAGISPDNVVGDIEFEDVWFAYTPGHWVLKGISFSVKAGQTVAVVGDTGSGKTTIISLLARFYDIQKGRITIDGIDIRDYNLSALRRLVAVVMQDVFLFSGNINYNIRLNEAHISDADIEAAVRTVCADGFINSLPHGYESEVSERGLTFSSGQRQLIAFARAVAFDPCILVLDEATANIDTATEAALQSAIEKTSANHTMIVIAHRLNTVIGSDMILVLQEGVIIERGNHAQLINNGGKYAALYEESKA